MIKVEWELDSGWRDDLVDLQGSVAIYGTAHSLVADSCTNIDNFLAAAVTIVEAFSRHWPVNHIEVDLVMEPNPLRGDLQPSGEWTLSYGEQTARFDTVAALHIPLRNAVQDFLATVPERAFCGNPIYSALRQFVQSDLT